MFTKGGIVQINWIAPYLGQNEGKKAFPAPRSLEKRRLRIKTKQDVTVLQAAQQTSFLKSLFQFICLMLETP